MVAFASLSVFQARPAATAARLRAVRTRASTSSAPSVAAAPSNAGLVHGSKNLVSLRPYFTVSEDNMKAFMEEAAKCNEMMAFGREPECVHYGWTQSGNVVQCFESYNGGDAAVNHITRCSSNIDVLVSLASDVRIEVHGCPGELEKMKEPLKDLTIEYFEGIAPSGKDPLANYSDPLEKYCETNEDADECRVYED